MRRPGAAALAAALLAATLLAATASAPASGQPRSDGVVSTVRGVSRAVAACWAVPEALSGFERVEATVRFSLKQDGSLFGRQRISYNGSPIDGPAREMLARSIIASVVACTPLRLAPGLGDAIAGRVFAVRFVYQGPKGRGA